MKYYKIFLWLVIVTGILLRFWQIDFTDVHTDEAQFMLDSRAHPPLAVFMINIFYSLFGVSLFSARLVSSVLGSATVAIIGLYTRQVAPKHALLVTAIAAVFTPHVLLSKYIYFDVPLTFFWVLLLYAYTLARKSPNFYTYCFVFLAAMCSYLTKVQGLLFPFLLFVIHTLIHWRTLYKDTLTWIMFFAGIPEVLYLLSMPDIGGIIVFFRPTLYGFYSPLDRALGIVYNWWVTLGIFSIIVPIGLFGLRKTGWPLWLFLVMALFMNMILSPHMFYLAYLIIIVVPFGIVLSKYVPKLVSSAFLLLFLVWSMYITRFGFTQHMLHPFYKNPPYWNENVDDINAYLEPAETVAALGIYGHQVNWYILPEVVNASQLSAEQLNTYSTIIRFTNATTEVPAGYSEQYSDEKLAIFTKH